jgi:tight adherence protein B
MTLILLTVAAAVLLAAQAVYHAVLYRAERKRGELRRRLQALGTEGRSGGLLRAGRMARRPGAARIVSGLPFSRDLERVLLQTDLDWTVASLLGTGFSIGVGSAVALTILLPAPSLIVLMVIPFAVAVPILSVFAARKHRSDKISEQLPDALDMMVRSLRAGHGVAAGLQLVTAEMPMPIAIEFGRSFEEQQAGASMRDTVRNMTERVPGNLDLRIFATSLVIQHETGGNLVEILENISTTIRSRYRFFGKLRALTSEARMSGRILGALPIVSALAVAVLNFEYMSPLFTELIGQVILLGGIGFWVAGVVWMRRLAQVEF